MSVCLPKDDVDGSGANGDARSIRLRRTPGFIGRGFRLKAGRFLVPGLHPRRPQMPSRPLPLSVHDARSCFLDAPSTIASLLPREAFGHVPQLHDESLPMSVPMTITPAGNLTTETPVGCPRFRRTSLGLCLSVAAPVGLWRINAGEVLRARIAIPFYVLSCQTAL